jgi:hypothetical protein
MLPWGIDFGDGIARHPTALYESLFVIALGVLLIPVWRRGPVGHTFKWFTASYLAFRLLVDTIKPGVRAVPRSDRHPVGMCVRVDLLRAVVCPAAAFARRYGAQEAGHDNRRVKGAGRGSMAVDGSRGW